MPSSAPAALRSPTPSSSARRWTRSRRRSSPRPARARLSRTGRRSALQLAEAALVAGRELLEVGLQLRLRVGGGEALAQVARHVLDAARELLVSGLDVVLELIRELAGVVADGVQVLLDRLEAVADLARRRGREREALELLDLLAEVVAGAADLRLRLVGGRLAAPGEHGERDQDGREQRLGSHALTLAAGRGGGNGVRTPERVVRARGPRSGQ